MNRSRESQLGALWWSACLAVVAAVTLTAAPCGATAPVRVSAYSHMDHVELEVHAGTGNLLAVGSFAIPATTREPAATYGVSVNLSTNSGASWSETTDLISTDRFEFISATIVHDYLYLVLEQEGGTSGEVNIYRFDVATGSYDFTFGTHTVVDVGAGELNDLVLFGNADGADGALYLALIDRDGNLRFLHAWDYAFADGGSAADWNEVTTGVTDAAGALDGAYNDGDSEYAIFASYYDYSSQLCVWRLSQTANNSVVVATDFATNDEIRIAADRDLVMVTYSYSGGSGHDIRVHYSADAGATWDWEAVTPGDGTTNTAPFVNGRWHRGMVVGYHHQGTTGDALATTRRPVEEAVWLPAELSTDIGLRTGTRSDVQPLASGGWGALFISDSDAPQALYFMPIPLIFADGFASADLGLWSSSAP